jgi:hypothetical protein
MKHLRLHHVIAWLLLVIMSLIVIHAPITVFIDSRFPQISDVVKAWKEMLMLAALVLLAIDYTRRRAWRAAFKDMLLWLIAGYAALHLLLLVVYRLPANAMIAGLMIDLRYIAYFALVYLFLKAYPAYKASFLRIAIVGAAIVVGFAVLQLVLPHNFLSYFGYGDSTIEPYITIDKNPAFVRENSTLRGPNPLGAYAVIVLSGAAAFWFTQRKKLSDKNTRNILVFFAVAGLVALIVSYARSAWIGAAIALVVLFVSKYKNVITWRKAGYIAVATAILGGIIYGARNTAFVQNALIHNNPTTGASVDSNAQHLESVTNGVSLLFAHPLGQGVGSSGSASLFTNTPTVIENQFLFVAHETGWLGLMLFIAITWVVLARLWRKRSDWMALAVFASGVGLVVVGLMLPVWADDTVSIVWWGIAAAILATRKETHGKTTNKKAKRAA